MATGDFTEVLRIVIEQEGDSEIGKLAKAMLAAGEAGEVATQDAQRFADALAKVADEAADTRALEDTVARYADLAAKQGELSDATERAGLKLRLATEAEQSAAAAVTDRARAVETAKAAQADYAAASAAARDAVRAGKEAQKEANTEWRASAAALKSATAEYERAAGVQGDFGEEAERAGLRLKLATEQEAASAAALRDRTQELDAARAAQRGYADGQDAVKDAVRAAVAAQKEANTEWRSAKSDLAGATAEYDKAATSQSRLADQIGEMGGKIEAAGLSTRDLAGAQEELARRSDATRAAVAGIADAEREAASFAAQLAAETKKHAGEQDQAAAAIDRHRKAAKEAAQETRNLGDSTNAATGMLGKLKGVLAGLAGVFSVASVVKGLKAIVGAGSEAEQAMGQLDAALASTSGAAGFTAEQLKAMADELRSSSNFSLEQIISAQTRMLSYVDVVGEQFPQAMQITIDQAARLGMSVEQSAEVVGKALQDPANAMASLSRQGFKLDESQKALLKSLQETGQMAEAQAIIMDMLTESYGGSAAAQRIGTIAGLWKGLRDRLADFLGLVSDSGVLEYFKGRLAALDAQIQRMAGDGSLTAWAQSIADAIIGTAKAVESAAKFLYDYSAAIVGLAKAYALVKVNAFLTGLSLIASGTTKATGAVRLLSAAIMAIPAVRLVVLGGAAIVLAKTQLDDLGAAIARNLPGAQALRDRIAALKDEARASAERIGEAAQRYAGFADVQLKSADAVAQMGDAQRAAYEKSRAGLEQYLALQVRYYEQLRRSESLNADGLKYLEDLRVRLDAARDAAGAFGEGVRLAGNAAAAGITAGAQIIARDLEGIGQDADAVKAKIASLLAGVDTMPIGKLGDVALALQRVGEQSDSAGERVSAGLGAALKDLSGAELLRFQMAASAAFEATGRSADQAAVVLRTTLTTALDRLGADAARAGAQFTATGRDILATFEAVASNALATGREITAAFEGALAGTKTRAEAEALGRAFEALGAQGKLGAREVEIGMLGVRDRLREIDAKMDPLADKFARFGLQSQAALNGAAQSAREFYQQVQAGAQQGVYAQEDVTRGFRAWAEAARTAAAESGIAAQAQVEAQIQAQASALGLTKDLQNLGGAGAGAGSAIADGFAGAESVVRAVGDAADQVSGKIDNVTGAVEGLTESVEAYRNPMAGFALDMSRYGEIAVTAFRDAQRYALDGITSVDAYRARLNDANQSIIAAWSAQREEAYRLSDAYESMTEASLDSLARQSGGYEALLAGIRQTITTTQDAAGAFNMLNDADLGRLQSAARAVEQRLQSIIDRANQARDSMSDMADSLQDQIDQMNGAQDRSETRRFKNQLEQMRQQAEAAGILNSQEYREAVARATELHNLKMTQIRDEAAARSDADAESDRRARDAASRADSRPSTTPDAGAKPRAEKVDITLNGKDFGGINPHDNATIQRLAQSLLPEIMRQIQSAARNSGRGY